MILARVEGSIVATKKNPKMKGRKLLVVRPVLVEPGNGGGLKSGSNTLVAVDNLGAGDNDLVLVVQGSSARLGMEDKDSPVDAVVIGIIDTIDLNRNVIYKDSQRS